MENRFFLALKSIANIPIIRPFSKLVLKKIYHPYLHKKQNKVFNEFALDALSIFNECMESIRVDYSLAFGTMLGAVREKGFIKHDLDIDTYIWIEDYSPIIIETLQEKGFSWISNYSIGNDKFGREDVVSYNGVKIDIFYIYPPINKYPYCCDFVYEEGMKKMERLPRRIEFPISKKRKLVDFENIKLFIPSNAEEICEFRYGPDYMTPNPKWNWIDDKNSIIEWRDKLSVTRYCTK